MPQAGETQGNERDALIRIEPKGFFYRPPKLPNQLTSSITDEDDLFITSHMGIAIVDRSSWRLVVDGLVEQPFTICWDELLQLPKSTVTAFHECYGSPIKPPDTNLWRIGNVAWTGVSLDTLLGMAKPKPEAQYVWSDGLEHGSFFEAKDVDRYQKDMPLTKALRGGCLVAYEFNGMPLSAKRGGPVRLIVPGYYGTNSVKWLTRLSLQETRSKGPFTTIYYNEVDPTDPREIRKRPCWDVEPNSFLLTTPSSEGEIQGPQVVIAGRAWGASAIEKVTISVREGGEWLEKASIRPPERKQYEWQDFETALYLPTGEHEIMARATDKANNTQPTSGRRNHAHSINIVVRE
ncbi:hypothetical protein LTR64_006968 [Lithohypha guttulata]|uniref:Sulfite oxidase n=1 Tax=Lithohypha guttulata TaxID=1690604 RepID=A0AAN7YEY0_9EURO|nr:hypothetical protein LTR51_004474 [Lithohypha guttulata]KAK5091082.1 hypothetical protein LTR05_001262 [Lithohypha guttulata]